jgi:hypothetical protein
LPDRKRTPLSSFLLTPAIHKYVVVAALQNCCVFLTCNTLDGTVAGVNITTNSIQHRLSSHAKSRSVIKTCHMRFKVLKKVNAQIMNLFLDIMLKNIMKKKCSILKIFLPDNKCCLYKQTVGASALIFK